MHLAEIVYGFLGKDKKKAPVKPEFVAAYQTIVQEAMHRIHKDGENQQEFMRAVHLKNGTSAARLLDADVRGQVPNGVGLYVDVVLENGSFHSAILPREKQYVTARMSGLGQDTDILSRVFSLIKTGDVIDSREYYILRGKAHH